MRLLLFCAMVPALFAGDAVVRIDSGFVSGVRGREAAVRVYKGIPYSQ
jgi:hypothetical protein